MRIGIISRWNATCGVSLHAELLGRELLRRGHRISVFASLTESANRWWHHRLIREDEDFVKRIYTELDPSGGQGKLPPEEILSQKLDVLIVESYEKIPYGDVEKTVRELKKRGVPSVGVIHEGVKEDISYSPGLFDAVAVFDTRYVKEVGADSLTSGPLEVIPYPCLPPVRRERRFADGGKVRFFSFGRQPLCEYRDFLEVLARLSGEIDLEYRVIRASDPVDFEAEWLSQEVRVIDTEEIYRELLRADFHLLPKGDTRRVVISSTFYQTVGSLALTVSRKSRFFEEEEKLKPPPLILYENPEDLLGKIMRAVSDRNFREEIRHSAGSFAEERRVERVADLFEALIHSVVV